MQFTHTAHHEGWVAGYNAGLKALNKETKPAKSNDRVVPRATFINPEVASVGMTQVQVKEKFGAALVGRYRVAALGRAVTENARFGLIKVVAHPKTKKILGAHMIGERAGEVIHEAALAIHLNATLEQLTSMIHAFPTYSEGLKAAAAMATLEN
jgi:pyruvate/2-oxoglutarate dehydrogenase complex dihydrolipoamide dehydrogenase (E3) component